MLISFPELNVDNKKSIPMVLAKGLGRLSFTTPTTGTIAFDSIRGAAPIASARFNAFKQTWDQTTSVLMVQFSIAFPGCTLPVKAIYRYAL